MFTCLFCAFLAKKYKGVFRKEIEELTGIKTVHNNVYQGGLNDQTYEGMILELPLGLFIGFILFYIPISSLNFWGYLGIIVSFSYPCVLLFLRFKTFSESNILENTGLGYHPAYCFIISLFSGITVLLAGFAGLNFPGHEFNCYLLILTGLFIQTVLMSPDLINKVVPFEIRTIGGYIFVIVITVILTVISILILFALT